jgi:putative methyltransferase (TIGR04325 family)
MKLNITPKVFDGVYSSFNDVKESSYNNPDSLEEMFNETSNKLKLFLDGSYIPTNARSPISNLIPLLIALAFEEEKKKIIVLDYGGGMGGEFIDCLDALNGYKVNVEYHVIDLEPTIESGMKIFPEGMDIHFHTSIMNIHSDVDIIYIGSTLQYIEDYQALIQKLAKLSPKYIFLTDNFMGQAKTFATAQVNMKDRRMAYWIFKLTEIIDLMSKNGYKNIYTTKNYQPFHNFDNFSDEYKIDDSCNLLFKEVK